MNLIHNNFIILSIDIFLPNKILIKYRNIHATHSYLGT